MNQSCTTCNVSWEVCGERSMQCCTKCFHPYPEEAFAWREPRSVLYYGRDQDLVPGLSRGEWIIVGLAVLVLLVGFVLFFVNWMG